MTNSKILEYGEGERTRLLTEIERQTLFCLKVALTPVPCPACHEPTSQVDASGKSLDDFDATGGTKQPFHCPNCKRALVEIVPFMASGPKYQWRLAEPIPR
jgi:transposase-like protein